MESLGYTAENQIAACDAGDGKCLMKGRFKNTTGSPGDWKDDDIDLPAFSLWTFLGKRDIYFGLKVYF